MTRPVWPGVVAAIALLTTLVACTPDTPEAESSSAPSTASTSTSTASPAPSTEPEAPFDVACDTIVPPSRRDYLTAISLSETPVADFFAKVRSEVTVSPYILMQDSGGVVCSWHNGYEVISAYGYAPLSPGQVPEAEAFLTGETDPYDPSSSYEASAYSTGTLWTSNYEASAFRYFLITSDGMFVATTTELLDEMLARVP